MFSRIAILLAAFYAASTSASITDCGAGTSVFTITELSMDPPDNVAAGQNVSLTLKYKTPVEVDGGKVTTALSLNGIPFPSSDSDLCASAPCPITVGEHDGSSWSLFPSGVSGKVQTTITWADNTTGQVFLCVKAVLRSSWGSWLGFNKGSWLNQGEGSWFGLGQKIRGHV